MAEKYENVTMPKRKILFNNFLGGLAWAFGTFFGFIIILIIIGSVLSRVNLIPVVGDFLGQVVEETVNNNPRLIESRE